MDIERYKRQIIIPEFGEKAQLKLENAKVLVIGAGGLGCPALNYLAAMGIGNIGIVDDDFVSLSNLHRQILYTTNDIGFPKAEIAAKRLTAINPMVRVTAHQTQIKKQNALEIIKDYDMIFDGTDNFESRYLINDACALLQKPLIFAAVSDFEGQLAIFNQEDENGRRCNYRDLFPVPPRKGTVKNCAENGVIGVLPGIIGTMAATELIKLFTGIGKPLVNKLLHYNALTCEQYCIQINEAHNYLAPKTEHDFLNWRYETEKLMEDGCKEIDDKQMSALQAKQSTLCIDVREFHEVPPLDPKVFKQVPMSELDSFLQEDILEKNIIIVCQHGIRSMAAAEAFQEKYGSKKHIYSLKGGVVKWKR